MGDGAAANMAEILGIVVAVSLALTQALGGLVTYLVEAVKQTKRVPDGMSGLLAIAIGMTLGVALGLLTDLMATESYGIGTMILLGAFAGALMAAGAIKTYKAMGEVNTKTDTVTLTSTTAEVDEAVGFVRDLKSARAEAHRKDLANASGVNIVR